MDRSNHYEVAFEEYMIDRRHCCIAVDETRRTVLGHSSVKNMDFLVCCDRSARLLVDVKGRRFPYQSHGKPRFVWECWSELEDIDGLTRWQSMFGDDYCGLLVFSYLLDQSVEVPEDTKDLWHWRDRRYLFRAVPVDEYRRHMRLRSPRWGTVDLPSMVYRQIVRPLSHFIQGKSVVYEEIPF